MVKFIEVLRNIAKNVPAAGTHCFKVLLAWYAEGSYVRPEKLGPPKDLGLPLV